jgi:carboxypeptidase family protein/TonB-dependent receptor-like protein
MLTINDSSRWRIILALAVFFAAAPLAHAQVKGSFTGIVSDPSGAVIPGATVTATNEATNVAVTGPANSEGVYTIAGLLPGFYTVKAEAKGFKSFVNQHIELTVGYVQRLDFKLGVGEVTQEVTVSGEAPLVETSSMRMSNLITAQQVQNLPLNGRNIFQLAQLAPGAVDVSNLITEPGSHGGGVLTTVVNGARVNMNGFMLDGISDKGLSGGSNTTPSVDTVQEFRVDTEVLSAEYGSTVGALTQIVTKSGSNAFHGDVYDYVRNEKFDSREFFEKPNRNPFKMNQFGATLGGPIKKNKLFFFGSYEGERTRVSTPESLFIETPQFRNLIIQDAPNSVAALLYKNFPGPAPTSSTDNLTTYLVSDSSAGLCTAVDAACVTAYGLNPTSGLGAALIANPTMPTFGSISASAPAFSRAQFFNGNQFSGKIDYQGEKDKVFGRYFFDRFKDPLYSPGVNGGNAAADVTVRGFHSPINYDYPQLALNWTHSFGATVLNEMRAGWNRNVTDVGSNSSGVPNIYFDPGEVEFGNYAGYPQIFHEEVFQYADIVSISRGKHNIKIGGSVQRNYENSEFNVGRPSYEFADSLAFALNQVEFQVAGVDPGTVDPTTNQSLGQAHLASNIRAWRNVEFGAFVNDDWKVSPRFTLNLGLRYDLYTRHRDKYHHETQFVLPSTGANLTERLYAVNCSVDIAGAVGDNGQPCDGGFAPRKDNLTTGDHNNFGPRLGFAWDVFGDGKTALRGGFGVAYQGEIYNPLSNSRWNLPFYSFNESACSSGTNVTGPTITDACIFGPVNGAAPTYTGAPSNIGSGPAAATGGAFAGNIQGWNPYNANGAFLTGIAFPNFRDPYVYGSHLSLEHEFAGGFVLKTSWVGTFGHKLYRAEDINRFFGGRDTLTGHSGPCATAASPYRVNCLFGRLRVWENSVNSNYDALQVVLDKRMGHGVELHSSYVWSHSLDTRSTWHSGATTSNGAAEGFSMDQAKPGLDYGNSIFDVRHRFTNSIVWELPWYKDQRGAAGHILGGWQINNILVLRGGFPWTPYCSASSSPGNNLTACDFNRDGIRNDRPNQPAFGNSLPSTDRAVFEPDHPSLNLTPSMFNACSVSPRPFCSNWTGAYEGKLGRNTFRGPNFQEVDLSLFKNIKASERVNLQFRAEAFNLFNRTNLQMPSATFGQSASQFGLSTATYFPREIQFALKMIF